jgi:hypothetical protein
VAYKIRAFRWERGWELKIVGGGVAQTQQLGDEADRVVRDSLREADYPDWDTAELVYEINR